MPACPNCGRNTMRTRDWACQWCGYPLLSRSYKKIDKTFKELQEERHPDVKPSSSEPEPYPGTERAYAAKSQPPPIVPEPPSEILPEARPAEEPEIKPRPVPPVAPEPALRPEAKAESILVTPAPSAPAPQIAPTPAPAPLPPPAPPPVVVPNLSTISDGTVLTVDEMDALYKADRTAAHARLAGKTIVIKGFVEKVFIRDHIDVRYVVLTGASKRVVWPVRCTFARETVMQMSRLSEGQEVALRGKYDSYSKNIIFKDCSLA